MKHLFVTYEIAHKLKKLGFNEECFSAYRNSDGEESLMGLSEWKNGQSYDNHEGFCAAPLYQQAFDWVFKKMEAKYSCLALEIFSDGSGWWCHYADEIDDDLVIDFNNKDETILKAIEVIETL